MAVLLSYLILCVWQFHLVRSIGVSLPFTSISYKATPIKPKSLSLSFKTNDSVESKISNDFEDLSFDPLKTSSSTQDEELSKNTVSVSRLLPQLGLISDNDSTLKDLNYPKQQNVDQNIYKVPQIPQNKIPNLRSNIKEESDVPKDVQNKKNTVNYNIKVISPPAVFSNFRISWPITQNVAYSKWLAERNKNSKNIPTTPIRSYPVRIPPKGKQESTTAWQKVKRTFSNNDETRCNVLEPLIQNNPINIATNDIHKIRNVAKNKDTIVKPKNIKKCTYDLDINKTPFNLETPSDNLFDVNIHQIPIKILDKSYTKIHDILPTGSGVINIPDITPAVSTLGKFDAKSDKINYYINSFNNIKDKQIPKFISMQNISSINPLPYGSKQFYMSDISPTLPKSSPPKLPEISEPQPICTTDHDSSNLHQGSSLDNIISFLLYKFISTSSDIPAPKSMRISERLDAPELTHPDIITDVAAKLSESPISFSVFDCSYPEVESPTYIPKPNVDILLKYTDNTNKKNIAKSPIPYISSVTINYMPHIESSDDIIIFV